MKKPLRTILIIVGAIVLLIGYWGVDNFVYPIKAVHPNYSDVERAFAQLQFPSDWKEISSSENRGLHGRDCDPFNKTGCFHKDKTFSIPNSVTAEDVKKILQDAGCQQITTNDISYSSDAKPSTSLNCVLSAGLQYSASIRGPKSEVYVGASTKQ